MIWAIYACISEFSDSPVTDTTTTSFDTNRVLDDSGLDLAHFEKSFSEENAATNSKTDTSNMMSSDSGIYFNNPPVTRNLDFTFLPYTATIRR